MRKQEVGRKCLRVGQQQMQVPAVVEPVAPEQTTAGRAEKLNVERLRWLRQHGKPHNDRWLTLYLPPARDHGFRDTADERGWLREFVHDVEHGSGVEGMMR
jgi:hypothetical protein